MTNIWREFENLLQVDSTEIATVTDTDGQRSTVELLSGDSLRVQGTAAVGAKVYIKGRVIQQEAPDLTQHNMILY